MIANGRFGCERTRNTKFERILLNLRALTKEFGLETGTIPLFSLAAAFKSVFGDFNPVTAGRDGFRCAAARFIGTMVTD